MDDYGNKCLDAIVGGTGNVIMLPAGHEIIASAELAALRARVERAEAESDAAGDALANAISQSAKWKVRADRAAAALAAVPVAAIRQMWKCFQPDEETPERHADAVIGAWFATLPQEVQP